ncbi:putative spermidine/putrescine transport system permease protein [Amycolatopsis bartoniae]|uniref:ABC transporter permease n=1 Tax=Amycolatopsis bartoniae TaxID=941986 RepID=A0A8H9IXI8_9PSEU|nr:ABC transporter permease [Amycolatopsis bartoniae]MBB2937211.1 putative spermidine/putrescine transport system permease protein [Amycolatopsis bartoniae]TVT09504.1 ABC transporter permease [Amycolatopsis bartoniae]GHF53291.1 ABC transporter permease [Amycolatopsis bartoniae]
MAKLLTAAGRVFAGLVFLFLLAPLVVLVVASFNSADSVAFPPSGFSLRWYSAVLSSADWLVSFQLSGLLVVFVVLTTIVLGTTVAYGLARGTFPGKGILAGIALGPLLIPEIIIALGLLYYLQGLQLTNTITGLWLAHSLIALPYVVRAVLVSAAGLDPTLERAAASLGASGARVFWTVTLPLLRPGIIAGAVFAAVTSLGEVAITALVAGANTTTVPLRIFSAVQFELDPSVAAVSTLLLLASVVVMLVLERFVRLSELL